MMQLVIVSDLKGFLLLEHKYPDSVHVQDFGVFNVHRPLHLSSIMVVGGQNVCEA